MREMVIKYNEDRIIIKEKEFSVSLDFQAKKFLIHNDKKESLKIDAEFMDSVGSFTSLTLAIKEFIDDNFDLNRKVMIWSNEEFLFNKSLHHYFTSICKPKENFKFISFTFGKTKLSPIIYRDISSDNIEIVHNGEKVLFKINGNIFETSTNLIDLDQSQINDWFRYIEHNLFKYAQDVSEFWVLVDLSSKNSYLEFIKLEGIYGYEKLHNNTDTTQSHNTENIDEIQKQRGSIYGSYTNNIIAREKIFNALREHNSNTPEGFNSFLQDVISKLVRLNNCPTHKDSIIDLKSYVDLWLKHVKGELDEKVV